MAGLRAIPGHSLTLACWVYSFFGSVGLVFNPGSQLAAATGTDQTVISHVFLTTNLAACAGGFFALTASWIKYGKPSLSLTLNGVLAGLVGVTAGCDLVSPFGAVMIGAICGIVMIFSVDFIDHIFENRRSGRSLLCTWCLWLPRYHSYRTFSPPKKDCSMVVVTTSC